MWILWWHSDEAPEAGAQGVGHLLHAWLWIRVTVPSLMDAVERDRNRGGSVKLLLDMESLGSVKLVIVIGNRSELAASIEAIEFVW